MGNNVYGIKDSANLICNKKSEPDKVYLYSDYGTITENQWQNDSVYAMSKDTRAIRWDHNKNSTLKVTFEIFDLKILSLMTGSDFVVGQTNFRKREQLTVGADNKVTLGSTPVAGSLILYNLDTDNLTNLEEITVGDPVTDPNTYSITGNEITLNTTSHPVGSTIAAFYFTLTGETSKVMTIKSDVFGANCEIFADTKIRDIDGEDKYVQMHYLNCKPKHNFTITMSASDITKLVVEFDVLKDSKSTDMATYTIIDD